MAQTRLIELLAGEEIKLSKSDQKIGTIVRANPATVIHMSIARLAELAGVSEPTVNRLCHKLGCDGYPDFKLKLAQELSSGAHLFVENMESSDDTQTVMNKILSSIESSVRSLSQSTSPQSIDEATALLCGAKTIYFFGMGASGPVALDAQHKFFRFGIPVVAQTDYINQRMMCSMLSKEDVAVFISYTGRTRELVEVARLARQNGASVLGLTAADSPLAKASTLSLNIPLPEDTDIYMPMTSRIMHLTVIDILATGVTLRRGPDFLKHLKNIKDSLKETRYPAK